MFTLSLCMIVKNEEEVIDRCLQAVYLLVDEIIIVDTGSTDDTVSYCSKYTDKVFSFFWDNDFAEARNFSFSKATCDYILWLDADDVIDPEQLQAMLELKSRLRDDVYFLQYDYAQDEYGQSICTLYRERIVRNDDTFRWKYPVHEVIDNTQGRNSSYEQIVIRHARTHRGATADCGRNLAILQKAITKERYSTDPRIWFYLGRELQDNQQFERAITVFQTFLAMPDGWVEEKIMATFRIAQAYVLLGEADRNNLNNAKKYAHSAIAMDQDWAEPYFVLGEVAFLNNDLDEAISWFKQCFRPYPQVLSPISREAYLLQPAVKLVFCYDLLRQYQQAWFYNEKALAERPQDRGLRYNRRYLSARVTNQNSIGWFGKSVSSDFPSYRIRALQLHQQLLLHGLVTDMLDEPTDLLSYGTVIFFKSFAADEFAVMQDMKELGKRIVLDVSEDLVAATADFPYYLPMIQLADTVICCSHMLASRLVTWNVNVVVIEDATEVVIAHHHVVPVETLTVGWFGMPENVCHAESLRLQLEQQNCRLVTIHTGVGHDKYWMPNTWQYHLVQCDVAIMPLDVNASPCKSNNKLTTAMSLGLPVVAAPLDAYTRIIDNDVNGLIAHNQQEWLDAICSLRNPERRRQLQRQGWNTVMPFRPANVALKWWKTLSAETYQQQAVDIIIPTIYNTPHLHHCVESIMACTQIPFNIIVIHNGDHKLHLPEGVTVINGNGLNYAASINLGIAHSKAPFICMLNDDVIVSDGWLEPLLQEVQNGAGFCNPLSNCDAGFLHQYDLCLDEMPLGAGVNYLIDSRIQHINMQDLSIYTSDIWSYKTAIKPRRYKLDWVPFFCTLTSRSLVEKVGVLDDAFNNGCEDVDYCRRAGQMGNTAQVNENSFVFHFGGTSTRAYIQENPDQKHAQHQHFATKYGAPLLCIHAGWAYENWNANTVRESGIGGSETAVAAIAEAFTAIGYRVVVCCACDGKNDLVNGVEYLQLEEFQHFADRHFIDVFIVSRYTSTLKYQVRAHKKYFWVHDISAIQDTENAVVLKDHMSAIDRVFCLSPWHREYVAQYHQISLDKIWLTGNGIDLLRFEQKKEKIVNRFIYSSSPDRSLDRVLRLFPAIKRVLPDATLHIYYGFDNWEKSLLQRNDKEQQLLWNEIHDGLDQEGVFYHGRVDQDTLAAAFIESDIWLYPTSFAETFCITALEAQASRTLCICTPVAGLLSTVDDRGIFLEGNPEENDFEAQVVSTITAIQGDLERKTMLLDRAESWALQQSWSSIAEKWDRYFKSVN